MFQTYNPDQFILFDAIASERDFATMWKMTDWRHIRNVVSGHQDTIAGAAAECNLLEIERQQNQIIGLPEAKMLAVDLVTRKKSRFTPGVAGILWKTQAEKMYAALHLDPASYRASPVLRFFLPRRTSDKVRPVGIPTMNDRAMQMLFTFALQPVAEVWGDPDSFGFRVSRSARDACIVIRQYLEKAKMRVWILDADSVQCFLRGYSSFPYRSYELIDREGVLQQREQYPYRSTLQLLWITGSPGECGTSDGSADSLGGLKNRYE